MAIKEQIILEGVNKTSKAFGQVQNDLKGVKGSMGGLSASAGKLKLAIGAAAGAFAAFGVVSKVQDTINQFDNLAKSARAAGSAASEEAFRGFQVLQAAMAEAGIDAATFDRAMLQTSSRLQAGVEGQKSYKAITDKLGDSIKDANGNLKTGDELLKVMINSLNEGTITTEDFAKVVGGRAGPLIQAQFASLNGDAETLAATLSDVEKHSNIVSLDAANNAELFNDTMGRMKAALGTLMTDAITPLLPGLTKLATDLLAKMPDIVEKVKAVFEKLTPTFKLIGTIVGDVVVPALGLAFDIFVTVQDVIMKLVDLALPGLKKGFEVLEAVVKKIVEFFQGVADALGNIYDKAIQLKDDVVGVFGDMGDKIANTTKGMKDKVTGFFSDMYEAVVGGSIVPDMVNETIDEFDRMNKQTVAVTKDMTDKIEKEIDDSLGDRVKAISDSFRTQEQITEQQYKQDLQDLKDYYKDRSQFDENYLKLRGMLEKRYEADRQRQSKARVDEQFGIIESGLFKELDLTKLTKEEIFELSRKSGRKAIEDLAQVNERAFKLNKAMNMASAVMNTAAGVTKALAQGGIFGPFLAGAILAMGAAQLAIISQQSYSGKQRGGAVASGQSYIVGEAGPELFTPGRTGGITPNNELGRDVNVSFTVNAIDAQSFNTALARQRDTIVAIVNEAVNDTGRRSITA